MAAFEEYTDPRLVALYDLWDPFRADTTGSKGMRAGWMRPGRPGDHLGHMTGHVAQMIADGEPHRLLEQLVPVRRQLMMGHGSTSVLASRIPHPASNPAAKAAASESGMTRVWFIGAPQQLNARLAAGANLLPEPDMPDTAGRHPP